MLRLLKWDFLNFIKKFGWLYIALATVILVAAVFPTNIMLITSIVAGVCTFAIMLFCVFSTVLSVAVPIGWLRNDSAQLMLSLPAKPWEILLSKLILSVCINASAWLLVELYDLLPLAMPFMREHADTDFITHVLGILTFTITLLFCYLLAKSFNATRHNSLLITILCGIAISVILSLVTFAFYQYTDLYTVTQTVKGDCFGMKVEIKEGYQWIETICKYVASIAIIVGGFFGCSALLKNRFER